VDVLATGGHGYLRSCTSLKQVDLGRFANLIAPPWKFGLIVASPLQRIGRLAEHALVPQAPPGNAHGEALPPAKTSGRAAGRPLPGRTWERVIKADETDENPMFLADETDENPMFLGHFIRFIRFYPLPPLFKASRTYALTGEEKCGHSRLTISSRGIRCARTL
jgi:hypothetical protein